MPWDENLAGVRSRPQAHFEASLQRRLLGRDVPGGSPKNKDTTFVVSLFLYFGDKHPGKNIPLQRFEDTPEPLPAVLHGTAIDPRKRFFTNIPFCNISTVSHFNLQGLTPPIGAAVMPHNMPTAERPIQRHTVLIRRKKRPDTQEQTFIHGSAVVISQYDIRLQLLTEAVEIQPVYPVKILLLFCDQVL